MNLKTLSDDALILRTEEAVQKEREATAEVLLHFREINRRRLYSKFKCKSINDYAMKIHGYTEDQAQLRVTAMYMLTDLPELETKVNDGTLTLSHLNLAQSFFRQKEVAAKIQTPEQKLELIEKLENTSKREASRILFQETGIKIEAKERVRELGEGKIEITLVAEQSMLEKLNHLKGILKHSHPNLTLSELVDKLCDLGKAKWDPLEKAKRSETRRLKKGASELTKRNRSAMNSLDQAQQAQPAGSPQKHSVPERKIVQTASGPTNIKQPSVVPPRGQTRVFRAPIPAQLKHQVFIRDRGICAICEGTSTLEIDHIAPVAKGGKDGMHNLRLLCRPCNQRRAIEEYGVKKVESFLRGSTLVYH